MSNFLINTILRQSIKMKNWTHSVSLKRTIWQIFSPSVFLGRDPEQIQVGNSSCSIQGSRSGSKSLIINLDCNTVAIGKFSVNWLNKGLYGVAKCIDRLFTIPTTFLFLRGPFWFFFFYVQCSTQHLLLLLRFFFVKGSWDQCFGSRSAWIRIKVDTLDPDPDPL